MPDQADQEAPPPPLPIFQLAIDGVTVIARAEMDGSCWFDFPRLDYMASLPPSTIVSKEDAMAKGICRLIVDARRRGELEQLPKEQRIVFDFPLTPKEVQKSSRLDVRRPPRVSFRERATRAWRILIG